MEELETCTEWCPYCEHEVELPYGRRYFECPSCKEMIAPCAQFSHSYTELRETGIPLCVCVTD